MSKAAKAVIALVIVVLVAAGVAALFMINNDRNNTGEQNTPSNQTPSNEQSTDNQNESQTEVAATITYTNDGFTIDKPVIRVGDTVRVVNDSNNELDFSSDPHPVHTDEPELNVGFIAPGDSRTFTVTQVGTWGFHNHLRDSHSGSIEVQE